jgi:hypothetical protein
MEWMEKKKERKKERERETQRETDKTPAPVTHFLMWVVVVCAIGGMK